MPHMYILECADGTYYTGSTYDLTRRFEEHSTGVGASYTAKRLPVRLAYSEAFSRIDAAFNREKQVQNWSHAKKRALIAGEISVIKSLGKKRFRHSKRRISEGVS